MTERRSLFTALLQEGLHAGQVGLGVGQRGFLMGQRRLVGPRIDLRQDLVGLDLVVEIDVHLFDRAGNQAPTCTFSTGCTVPVELTIDLDFAAADGHRPPIARRPATRGNDGSRPLPRLRPVAAAASQSNSRFMGLLLPGCAGPSMARAKSVESQSTCPSRSTIVRRACRATSWSWVTRMMVM